MTAGPKTAMEAVAARIRKRISQKVQAKTSELHKARQVYDLTKANPMIISDSDSDGELNGTKPVSTEPPPKVTPKLAPPPESYPRADIKIFANMARAIRNTSDGAHVTARLTSWTRNSPTIRGEPQES